MNAQKRMPRTNIIKCETYNTNKIGIVNRYFSNSKFEIRTNEFSKTNTISIRLFDGPVADCQWPEMLSFHIIFSLSTKHSIMLLAFTLANR